MITIAVVLRLPDEYTSSATFALIQQQVSKQYVDQMTTGSSAEMIRAVTREVLSVPRLSGIVDSFGLYQGERGKLTSEQLGEKLRESIAVAPVDQVNPRADYTAFRLSYTAENARLSQQVLGQLASLFIEINLKERGSQAQTTTSFLKSQLDAAKQRLDAQEKLVLNAKMNTADQSPAVHQAKLGVMSDLRMQLQSATNGVSRVNQQRAQIEGNLNAQLVRLQRERAALLTQYTAKHPEIIKKDKEMESIQAVVTAIRNKGPVPPSAGFSDLMLQQSVTQLESLQAEGDRLEKDAEMLRNELNRYQNGMLAASPVRAHELESVQKDYDLLKQEYSDLQLKYFRAQMSANLEEEQSGQNFRLVDPPTLPAFPSGPKRLKISLMSIAGGLALGLLLAFVAEMRNQTFLREVDMRKAFEGALVIGIPVLTTPNEEGARVRKRIFEMALACIMLVAVGAAEYYIFLHG
ncbi:hypothetical protein F183_A54570 (plasmid) [Bryobacterales bacterium F-183]|nr:hypothetical protein F183_A54570 [Bryobacterales bacterium F-183]